MQHALDALHEAVRTGAGVGVATTTVRRCRLTLSNQSLKRLEVSN